MKQVRALQIVVASPNDVQLERDQLEIIAAELNRTVARDRGLRLDIRRWETEAYPGFHAEGAQGLIDPLLQIEDCDLLIGIFWRRFGTPTMGAGSGTEHEFLTAYCSWKATGAPQIMFYFNQSPFTPSTNQEAEQLRLVLEFKERFPAEGLWWEYGGKDDFKDKVRQHLTLYLLANFQSSAAPTKETKAIERTFSELRAAHRNEVRRAVGKIRLFGNDKAHDLDQVFVTLSIAEGYDGLLSDRKLVGLLDAGLRRKLSLLSYYSQETTDIFSPASETARRTIATSELLRPGRQTVVTGAPGCGKTTLLKYLALQSDSEDAQRWVVYLELKAVHADDLRASKNLPELLFAKSVAEVLALSNTEMEKLRPEFLGQLKAGQGALFLDGLDEVRHQSIFGHLCEAISEFVQDETFKDNTLILSTRPFGLHRAPLGDLEQVEIQPLTDKQIEAFLKNYYPGESTVQGLLRDVKKPGALRDLARVPVMLAGIIELYMHDEAPDESASRLDIYEKITRGLALKIDREKNVRPFFFRLVDPEGTIKLDFLQRLAFERLLLDENETGTEASRFIISDEDLLTKAKAFVKDEGLRDIPPHALADDVRATPLLREVSERTYAFAHTTLQEYLAAKTLVHRGDREEIFSRSCFNVGLVAQELLPMFLGLVKKADELYDRLERLPESLTFSNFRLGVRGLSYAAKLSQDKLAALLKSLKRILVDSSSEEDPYRRAILRDLLFLEGDARKLLEKEIIPFLKDTSSFRNLKAAEALTIIGTDASFGPLVEALNPRAAQGFHLARYVRLGGLDEQLVHYICSALVKINPSRSVPVLESIHTAYSYGEIDRLLRRVGTEEAFAALLTRRTRIMDWLSSDAARDLQRLSKKSDLVTVLINALSDRRDYVRSEALEILGLIASEDHVKAIADCLRDPHFTVRWKAANALERIGSAEAVGPLCDVLLTGDPTVAWCAASALGSIGSEKAVDRLIEALKVPDPDVNYHAAFALGQIGSDRAVESLVELLKGPADSKSRSSAAYALARIKSKRALSSLLEFLTDPSPEVRAGIAYALGGLWSEEVLEPLHARLSDGSPEVRRGVSHALGEIGSEESLPHLVIALRHEQDHQTRRSMIEALGGIDSMGVIKPLLELHASVFYAHEAAEGLAKVSTTNMVSGLPPLLRDSNKLVRQKAVQTVGYYCSDPTLINELTSLSQNDSEEGIRIAALDALQRYVIKLELFRVPLAKYSQS